MQREHYRQDVRRLQNYGKLVLIFDVWMDFQGNSAYHQHPTEMSLQCKNIRGEKRSDQTG